MQCQPPSLHFFSECKKETGCWTGPTTRTDPTKPWGCPRLRQGTRCWATSSSRTGRLALSSRFTVRGGQVRRTLYKSLQFFYNLWVEGINKRQMSTLPIRPAFCSSPSSFPIAPLVSVLLRAEKPATIDEHGEHLTSCYHPKFVFLVEFLAEVTSACCSHTNCCYDSLILHQPLLRSSHSYTYWLLEYKCTFSYSGTVAALKHGWCFPNYCILPICSS